MVLSIFNSSSQQRVIPYDKLKTYFIGVIFYNIFVILWGAYVRASGSGAGCGNHWPLCNGQILPVQPGIQTQIEFFHRVTSGLSLFLILGGVYWIFRLFPKGSAIRKLSGIACLSIITEALIGAGLVLFELVLHNQSLKRTLSISLHFANTLILLGALVLTVACLNRKGRGANWSQTLKRPVFLLSGLYFGVGMAGAVTALGDTLFPAVSLTHGFQQDLNSSSHFLIKLRILHPILAVSFVAFSTPWIFSFLQQKVSPSFKSWGQFLISLLFLNVGIGILNLLWLAPLGLQIFHLCMAVTIWIVWIIFVDQMTTQNLIEQF